MIRRLRDFSRNFPPNWSLINSWHRQVSHFCQKIKTMASSLDSQDKNSSKEMDTKPIEEGIDALEFSRKTMIPNAKKLRDMGQSFTSAIGQLTNFSRSSTIVTSPTTPLSPRTEQMIQSKCTYLKFQQTKKKFLFFRHWSRRWERRRVQKFTS